MTGVPTGEQEQSWSQEPGSPISFLASVALFAKMGPGELEDLAACLRRRTYKAREVIFHRDDPGTAFYIIASGSVKIYLPSPEGEEALLAVLQSGDYFGEVALLDGLPRIASAATMQSTEVFLIYRDDFLRFIREHPPAVEALFRELAALVRRERGLLEDVLFLNLRARLAKRLLQLAERHGERIQGRTEIRLVLTQNDLAGMVGATRVSVNRVLNQFRDTGVLDWTGRQLVILKPQELRRHTGSR